MAAGLAAFLAVVFGQIGFLGHDAGHRQVFASHRANYALGVLCGNLGIGLSYGWWTSKHNRHHAHPNTEGADPDVMIGPLTFYRRPRAGRPGGIRAALFRYQAYLLLPLLFLEGANLHLVQHHRADSRRARDRPPVVWEAGLLILHAGGYLGAVFLVLSPLRAVVFILVQQGLSASTWAARSHPTTRACPCSAAEDKTGFLRQQVLTSRNVRGGRLTDFALGGLNYQIEHHLFPSMPRPSLRRAQPLVAAFCAEHGLSYCEKGLVSSYSEVLRHRHAAGR